MIVEMQRTTVTVALFFLLLGGYLVASALELPAGSGSLPGAGFFPQVIGVLMILLAAALGWEGVRGGGEHFQLEHRGAIAGVIGLFFGYLLLWGTGLFALRTAAFLVLFLRFLGQSWKASVTVAVVLTATVTIAFQIGLRVSLE